MIWINGPNNHFHSSRAVGVIVTTLRPESDQPSKLILINAGPAIRREAAAVETIRRMEQDVDSPPSAHNAILSALPMLRAYAVLLTGNRDRADDVVQETLVRAFTSLGSLQQGANALAWLITILRNRFISEHRRRRHEVADPDEGYAQGLAEQPAQDSWIAFQEFREALSRVPLDQRDALILVAASGFSYDEAAQICGCPVGTIKSRVNRARSALVRELARDHTRGSSKRQWWSARGQEQLLPRLL